MNPVRNNQIVNRVFAELSGESVKGQTNQHITDALFWHILFLTG